MSVCLHGSLVLIEHCNNGSCCMQVSGHGTDIVDETCCRCPVLALMLPNVMLSGPLPTSVIAGMMIPNFVTCLGLQLFADTVELSAGCCIQSILFGVCPFLFLSLDSCDCVHPPTDLLQ